MAVAPEPPPAPARGWDRRDVLRLMGAATVATGLGACSGSSDDRSSSASSTSSTAKPRPSTTTAPKATTTSSTPPAPPSEADWTALSQAVRGGVTRPPDRTYEADRVLFNPLFDGIRPQGIAHCATAAEVATSLAFARHHGLPFTARSGGHSFGGYSTSQGLVIDLEPANQVQVQGNGTATVGSGARLGDVYARLADRGVMIPAGSCPSVGIAGLTLGGGVGVVARKYGLTIDNLRAAEIVVADGRTLTCDANREPDLFWALRGGGGGNFGIVTSFTFATHPAPTLALASIHWPWSAAGAVLSAWLDWAPSAPDELWSNALLLAGDDKRAGVEPTVRIGAAFVGAAGALRDLLDSLVATVGAAPSSRSGRTVSYLDAMTYEGGGSTAREASVARSEYLAAKLPPAGIQTVVDAVARRQADPQLGGGGAAFDAYGGAINRVAPAATAFVHRDPLCGVLFNGTFADDAAPVIVEANRSWVDDLGSAVKPYVNGEAYQNYIDPRRADWADAYYGRNLDRLRAVKGRYDPDDVFHFAQSIPLP